MALMDIRRLLLALGAASAVLVPRFARADETAVAQVDAAPPFPAPASQPGPPPAAEPAPPPQPPPPPPVSAPQHAATSGGGVELTTLRLLRDKGLISQAEFDDATRDIRESTGTRAGDSNTVVLGKWSTTLYGFIESDTILDTTRSFNDLAGNAQVARPGSTSNSESRLTFGVRNSRIGFRVNAPETNGIRTSALLEMDFLGNQPPNASEAAFLTNPTFRIRHFKFDVKTPVVDVMIGQYWQLFGWQSAYQPNTVEIQGVPGEVYSRTPQIRISKAFETDPVTVELALAATRPVQRDAGIPDGQGGLRIAINKWTGLQTVGSTGTQIAPLSFAATGYVRRVKVDELSASPKNTNDKTASGVALDGYVPIIPATKEKKDNALSLNGEFATGYGIGDFYTGLTGGAGFPTLANPTNATPAPAYAANIDPGIATYGAAGDLHYIQWTSFLVGLQYYLPATNGRAWVSGNFSHMTSANLQTFTARAKARSDEYWFDANFFVEPVTAVRVGLEYANFRDVYGDGVEATNHRFQLSAFFLF
jgi:hypothetical protein